MTKGTNVISMVLKGAAVVAALGAMAAVASLTTLTVRGGSLTEHQARRVERGRYLVTISACHDCHSPKADAQMTIDDKRPLSGRPHTTRPPSQSTEEIKASLDLTAWSGPWGVSYAANLTPDKETGLGARYTEQLFVQTLRTGKKPEGEALLPPMPWNVYRNMTDEDLKSVFAYLQTLKPVRNFVRASPRLTN